ncbi:MAG TPA: ATP-binding protein [Hyphomicrobium sp.]|nr:ATP-binding protein [Hyphomicrobium sp.]
MRSWSMNRRLLLILSGIIGILWIAGVTASALMMRHEIDEVFDSALQETAQRILPLAADEIHEWRDRKRDGKHPKGRVEVDDDHEEYILYQVRDASGRVILRSHDAPEAPFSAPMKRGYHDDGERRYFTEWSADKSLAIQVAELPKERAETMQALWLGLLVPLLVVLPVAGLAVHMTVKHAIRPVQRLQGELMTRDGTNLAPLDGDGLPDELMPVVKDVNRLLSRLNAALEAERAFASNSAHELRNPIAAAQAQAGLLAATVAEPEQCKRAHGLVSTLAILSRRIETLLQLARAESGMALAREDMSLRELVELLMTDWLRKPSTMDRLRFENVAHDPLVVSANADALGIAIQNLIGNALKHSPPDSPVVVHLGPQAELSIVNSGRVVPPQDLAHLKERFARASNGAREGSGLGLYIADTIARQSGARLDLYSPARGASSGFEAVLRWQFARPLDGGASSTPLTH